MRLKVTNANIRVVAARTDLMPPLETASHSARVFISYRSQDPDLTLAKEFYEALKAARHQPFMAGACVRSWWKQLNRLFPQVNQFDWSPYKGFSWIAWVLCICKEMKLFLAAICIGGILAIAF